MEPLEILIGADICVTESNKEAFIQGNINKILDTGLLSVLENVDIRIFNLEGPLADKSTPIDKNGLNLIMPRDCINGIAKLKPSLLTLANNHIMDQGNEGLESTLQSLDNNKIKHNGAGFNITEAKKPCLFEIKGRKIGEYACAEHEFSIAHETIAGANPLDPLTSLDDMADLKRKCDYVIVLYHGSKEYYRYPTPYI